MAWAPFAAAAIGPLMNKFFGGGGDKMKKIDTMTKEQKALLKNMMQMLGGGGQLGQGYQGALGLQQQLMDPSSEAVQQFADPYMKQFEQQTVPGLAERFAGMGAMGGGMSSSGFGQALGAAGGNLQSQLAALKAGLGQQAAGQLMQQYGQMAGMGLSAQPFGYAKPQQSGAQGFMQGWAGAGFPGMTDFANWWQNSGPIIGNI